MEGVQVSWLLTVSQDDFSPLRAFGLGKILSSGHDGPDCGPRIFGGASELAGPFGNRR